MSHRLRRALRGTAVVAFAAGLVALLVSAVGPAASPRREGAAATPAQQQAAQQPSAPAVDASPSRSRARGRRRRRPKRAPRPVRIEIPAIGVRAPVVPLGLNRDRTLEVPKNFADTGWWSGGWRPGEPGPAVVAGHVDSYTGPAVFYRLPQLRSGDGITIVRRDGSRVRFRVQRSEHYSKAHFPTARVYGPTRRPALRLITCSGAFDRASGHYLDNTVVYAARP